MRIHDCEIAYLFLPAHQVSGDMFNYFTLDGGRLGFYTADVAGHGVRSGLVAATLGHIVSPKYFRDHGELSGLAQVTRQLNRRFNKADYDDTYFTMLSGIVDFDAETLHFVQAGHPHPLLVPADGPPAWLGGTGLPVGLVEDADWTQESVAFNRGSRLILYSDGVIEATTPDAEMFGEDRLQTFILNRQSSCATQICKEIADELGAWMGKKSPEDDITMIVIDRKA